MPKPSTAPKCLMCDKALAQQMKVVWRAPAPAEEAYRAELRAEYEAIVVTSRRAYDAGEMEYKQYERAKRAAERHALRQFAHRYPNCMFYMSPSSTQIVETTPTGKFGVDGEGFFHSNRCGFLFGILSARAGYRRKAVA